MEKAKNDDKLKRGEDHFNPNVAFLVIVLCFLFMIPFRLDLTLQSIWINDLYHQIYPPIVIAQLMIAVWLTFRWRVSHAAVLLWSVMICSFFGLPIAFVAHMIPSEYLLTGLVIFLTLWIASLKVPYPPSLLAAMTIITLLGSIVFITAISEQHRDRFSFANIANQELLATSRNEYNVYHLTLSWNNYDGNSARLYECNHQGFFCERIASDYVGYSSITSDRYDLQATEDGVVLTIDGELVYPLGDEE